MKQVPQETLNGTTTRSPARSSVTLGPDLGHDAHRLVAEDVALVQERPEHLVEVQVGAADAGRGDLARSRRSVPGSSGRARCRRGRRARRARSLLASCPPTLAEPGSAICRCIAALTGRAAPWPPAPCALVPQPTPATIFLSPFISASKPCSATCAGSSLLDAPTLCRPCRRGGRSWSRSGRASAT